MKKILAVASGGDHWVELLRLTPAFAGCDVAYVAPTASHRVEVGDSRFYVFTDANRQNKWRMLRLACKLAWIVLQERPAVLVSTGAAAGYIALRLGKLMGAKTVWIDSIANAEKLSLPGRKIGKYADLWLTQWPHLAEPAGPHFVGAVL